MVIRGEHGGEYTRSRHARAGLLSMMALVMMLCATLSSAQTPEMADPPGQETIPVEFELRRVGRVEILGVQQDNQMYLPVKQMFDYLKIKNEFDPVAGTVTGFFITPDTSYTIDARDGVISVGNRTASMTSADYILRENDLYLRPELFDRMFGLSIKYRPRQLSAYLATNLTLPVFLDQRLRRLERELALKTMRPAPDAAFGRPMAFLDGARLDYSIRQNLSSVSQPSRSFFTRVTGHVLGGDVEARFNGSISPNPELRQTRARWRYVPQEPTFLMRQVTVGDFVTSGILSRQIYGVEVTSRPPYQRITFGDQEFIGSGIPERNTYFYNNFRLLQVEQAESTGTYSFETPLRYGVNRVDITRYSEWGEVYAETYRIFIPTTFLPPKEVDYGVSGGRLRDIGDPWYGEMHTLWGVSSRITAGAQVEYFDMDNLQTKVYPTFNMFGRIGEHLLADASLSPNAFNRASMQLTLPSLVSAAASFTSYRRNSRLFNPRDAINEINAQTVLPFDINSGRIAFDVGGTQTIFEQARERSVRAGLSGYFGVVSPRITTRAGWLHSYVTGGRRLTFHETEPALRVRLPGNLYFATSLRYDHRRNQVIDARVNAALQPRPNLNLEFLFDRNFVSNSNILRFRLQYVLPFLRFTGIVTSSARSVLYTQTVSGSIGVAPEMGEVFFDNNASRAGFGAIMVAAFLDANGNGRRDAGEEFLTSARVKAARLADGEGFPLQRIPDVGWGTVRAVPYFQYTVEIDRTGFDSPLWIPRYDIIEVSSAPGRFTYIELPVLAGGAVRGAVYINGDEAGQIGVEGIKLTIRAVVDENQNGRRNGKVFERTVQTFSNGDYEFIGVPPGTYEISLDTRQLTLSGLAISEPRRTVTVQANRDGDFVEGVNFVLTEAY